MTPFLFVNRNLDSNPLTKSTGAERFLIGSHVSLQRRKKKPAIAASRLTASSHAYSGLHVPTLILPAVFAEPDAIDSEHGRALVKVKHPILECQISALGQYVDSFDCTAMPINQDTFEMIEYFLIWTTPRNKTLALGRVGMSPSSQLAVVKPNEVVERAIRDELHMSSLLAFVACLMDAEPSAKQNRRRLWAITNRALGYLRTRLQSDQSSDLIPDILYLAYTALYLGQISAARNHLKALHILVVSAGYSNLTGHTLPSMMYADECCSLPSLRPTMFDMSRHELSRVPPMPWSTDPSLRDEAQYVQTEVLGSTVNTQCREYASDIVEMAQVLHSSQKSSGQSVNAHWVMIRCLALLSNLLVHFPADTNSTQTWQPVASHTNGVKEPTQAARLEVTRICLLLWLLLLRKIVWGSEKCDFMRPFEASVFQRYRNTEFGHEINIALSSWSDVPEDSSSVLRRLGTAATASSAARTAAHRAAAVTRLESSGDVRLGRFMNCFLQLVNDGQQEVPSGTG